MGAFFWICVICFTISVVGNLAGHKKRKEERARINELPFFKDVKKEIKNETRYKTYYKLEKEYNKIQSTSQLFWRKTYSNVCYNVYTIIKDDRIEIVYLPTYHSPEDFCNKVFKDRFEYDEWISYVKGIQEDIKTSHKCLLEDWFYDKSNLDIEDDSKDGFSKACIRFKNIEFYHNKGDLKYLSSTFSKVNVGASIFWGDRSTDINTTHKEVDTRECIIALKNGKIINIDRELYEGLVAKLPEKDFEVYKYRSTKQKTTKTNKTTKKKGK